MIEKRKLSLGVLLSTFVCVLLFAVTINVAYAYFSATTTKEITINFHTLEVNVAETTSGVLTQQLKGALPGDTINFSDVKISNTGSADAYTLVNLEVTIAKSNQPTITYNEWYNLDGTKVDTSNFAINTAGATHLSSDETKNLNLNWTIPGSVDDNYQVSTITTKVTAHALQTYLPDARAYVNEPLYASSFIIKQQPNANLFNINNTIFAHTADLKVEDNNLIATAKSTSTFTYSRVLVDDILAGTEVTLSGSWVASGSNQGRFGMYYYDTKTGSLYNSSNPIMQITGSGKNVTATIPEKPSNTHVLVLLFYANGNGTAVIGDTVTYYNVKLEKGNTATEYVPYINANSEPLMVIGKNLFDMQENFRSESKAGVTVEYLAEQDAFKINGTINTNAADFARRYINIPVIKGNHYVASSEYVSGTITKPEGSTAVAYFGASDILNNSNNWQSLSLLNRDNSNSNNIGKITCNYNYVSAFWFFCTKGVSFEDYIVRIQLEEGDTSTEYQKCYKDTYNKTTKTITRNIRKLVLTGEESWTDQYVPTILFGLKSGYYGLPKSSNSILLCSHTPSTSNDKNFGVRITNESGTCIGFSQCFEGFGVANLAEFKAYLKAQYDAGTPVTIWYQLATPQIEVIE